MPKPTPMELKDIEVLERDAQSLTNGRAGDMPHLCGVVGRTVQMFCIIFKQGIMTPDECARCDQTAGAAGDRKDAPRLKVGPIELTGFKFRDMERWAIIAGIIWLLLSQHGIAPSPFAKKIAEDAAKAVVMTPVGDTP